MKSKETTSNYRMEIANEIGLMDRIRLNSVNMHKQRDWHLLSGTRMKKSKNHFSIEKKH